MITRGSNTYGPYQYPEKLIPLFVTNALEGEKLPLYGDGLNVRDWLHVDDHADGIEAALLHGEPGEVYNIGGGNERTNREITTHHPRRARPRRGTTRSSRSPTAPDTTAATRSRATRRARTWAGSRGSTSSRACARPSAGTATTSGGGARSSTTPRTSPTGASAGTTSGAERVAAARVPDRRIRRHARHRAPARADERGVRFVAPPEARLRHHRARWPSRSQVRAFAADSAEGEIGRARQRGGLHQRRGAEDDPERAYRVNEHGAAAAGRGGARAGLGFVHVSTDFVFDGDEDGPVRRDRRAQSALGLRRVEARGRAGRADAYPDATIVRTAWVFGAAARTSR